MQYFKKTYRNVDINDNRAVTRKIKFKKISLAKMLFPSGKK